MLEWFHKQSIYISGISTVPIFGGLLARHGACLSALLYKSTLDRFDGTNVEQEFWFFQTTGRLF